MRKVEIHSSSSSKDIGGSDQNFTPGGRLDRHTAKGRMLKFGGPRGRYAACIFALDSVMHWRPDDEPPGNDVGRNLACSLAASDEGPPDVNPNFDSFAEVEDYPYAMRQGIRATETVHLWHTFYLENEISQVHHPYSTRRYIL
jgi:hypothetical protein